MTALAAEEAKLNQTIRQISSRNIADEVQSSHSGDGSPVRRRRRARSSRGGDGARPDELEEESESPDESDEFSPHSSDDAQVNPEDLAQARRAAAQTQKDFGILPDDDDDVDDETRASRAAQLKKMEEEAARYLRAVQRRSLNLETAIARLDRVQSKMVVAAMRSHDKV